MNEIDKYVPPATAKGLNQYTDALLGLKSAVGGNLFAMGGLLSEVRENKLYEEQYETWNEFLGSPEVSMGRSWASKLMKVYRVFSNAKLEYPAGVEIDKVYLITPFLENDPKDSEDWIGRLCLSRSDLRRLIDEVHGKKPKESSLGVRIGQFIEDHFNAESDLRKELLREGITRWEAYG